VNAAPVCRDTDDRSWFDGADRRQEIINWRMRVSVHELVLGKFAARAIIMPGAMSGLHAPAR
jgi:hypothetical protein